MRTLRLACVTLVLAAGGCHSLLSPPDGGTHATHDMTGAPDDLGMPDLAVSDDGGAGGGDMSCTPKVTSCLGLCGPISDPCLGRDVLCGGCPMSQVCNLVTHMCEVPKKDCSALGATCGNTRNSCGTRLFCGDCAAGQECNNDTNTCQACSYDLSTPAGVAAACQKQGFECGPAWLGCGPESTISDCGSCPPGPTPVCNPYFHVCEPQCTPPPKAQACADALANHGIECGTIDDGCGGFIDCGSSMCAAGTACGAQGDPGRCEPLEPPNECVALGRNCGTITSQCGGTINCGSCMAPQVCNPNGVCGPPCTPLTCATAPNPPVCGTIPDGCGGTIGPCGMCPSPTGYTCVNNMCCKLKTCAVDYKGMCGTGLPDGCGKTINCGCSGGSCTTKTPGQTGTCCVNTATCPAGSCDPNIKNTCTGQSLGCHCGNNQFCDATTYTCHDCTVFPGITHDPGQLGDQCSNGPAFNYNGQAESCPCAAGLACSNGGTVVSGTQKGTCCQDTACNGQPCGTQVTNTCTGQSETCGCPGGQFCDNGTCTTCSGLTSGQSGAPCGTFNIGNGNTVSCGCAAGLECITSGPPGPIAGPGQMGICCAPTRDSCGGRCNLPGPITTDSCTGATVTCSCDAQHYCNGSPGTCTAFLTCANYQPTGGGQGDQCGTLSNGNGGSINCPCNTAADPNIMCVNGTCQCTPNVACTKCTDNGKNNGCGTPISCTCPDNGNGNYVVCDPSGSTTDAFGCCYPYSATHYPPGWPAQGPNGSLGKPTPICTPPISNGCGGSFSIACPKNNPNGDSPSDTTWPNVQCVVQGGGYGLCECTPTPCINLPNPTGLNPNDGCGNSKNCGT